MSAVEELQRCRGCFGPIFMCVGVGQGIGLIVERV